MKVPFGNWVIETVPKNFVLSEIAIYKEGKNEGEEYENFEGFYPKLFDVMDSLDEKNLMESNVRSVSGLKKDIRKSKKEIKGWCDEIMVYLKKIEEQGNGLL